MYFVNKVDLVAAPAWEVLGVVEELPGIVDAGARCRIYLDQIDKPILLYFQTN